MFPLFNVLMNSPLPPKVTSPLILFHLHLPSVPSVYIYQSDLDMIILTPRLPQQFPFIKRLYIIPSVHSSPSHHPPQKLYKEHALDRFMGCFLDGWNISASSGGVCGGKGNRVV